MKIARINGRAHIVSADGGFDVAAASNGAFSDDPQDLLTKVPDLQKWVDTEQPVLDPMLSVEKLSQNLSMLDAPITNPSQIFAIGLNYKAHSEESGLEVPKEPMVFTKFPSSLAGPSARAPLPSKMVDWEVELVVVIGTPGRNISKADAMTHVAAYCVGQDVSDRASQFVSTPAQFSLAKSFASFSPIGPWLTTSDDVDASSLRISCRTEEQVLQDGNTSQLIFDIPTLISYLSNVCELRTGDLIFTGTPDGVGIARSPHLFIDNGWVIESTIDGLGTIRTSFGDL